MTKEDIAKLIADEVSKAAADRYQQAEEKAQQVSGNMSEAEKLAAVAKAGEVSGERATLTHDPRKGKGLDFVRFVKAYALGRKSHTDPADMAKALGYREEICDALSSAKKKTMSAGSFSEGGSLVPETISGDFIELLRSATVVLAAGARTIPFKGVLSMHKQTAAGSASFVGEETNIPVSNPTYGQLRLSAKLCAAIYPATNALLQNPSAGAEALIRDDMIKVMALKKDLTALRAVGGEHSPRGIRYMAASGNVFASAGVSLANKVSDLGKMVRLVEESDVAISSPGFIMNPRTKWDLATQLDSNGNFVFMQQMMLGQLFGFPYYVTTQIPKNLGGGSNESEIYFGEFSELLEGVDSEIAIEAFPNGAYHNGTEVVSGISQATTPIRALESYDFGLRHDSSFSVMTGVTWGA